MIDIKWKEIISLKILIDVDFNWWRMWRRLIDVDERLYEVDDEFGDGVSVRDGVRHRVGVVSSTQDATPAAILGELNEDLKIYFYLFYLFNIFDSWNIK